MPIKGVNGMLVAICDDESFFREELKSMIFRYKTEHRLHIDVYEYATGNALLASNKAFDMVFLDYQMPGMDGMETARMLRGRNFTSSIVFVTSFPQFMQESFEVQPFRFLIKPIEYTHITALLNVYIRQQKLLAPLIVINDGEQTVIPSKDILYLEGNGKYCTVRTLNSTYSSSKTLAQAHALLPQHCFFRSHKSYVVNLYSIRSFDKSTAVLINDEVIKIGHNKISEFKHIYCQFVKDYYVEV